MKQGKYSKKSKRKILIDKQSLLVLSFFGLVVLGLALYQVFNAVPPSIWVSNNEQLPNNKVCMVNDTYLGVQQIEVPVDGQIYYGCCDKCVITLNQEPETRYAIDPFTGEKINKAEAFIYLNPDSKYGGVLYFNSRENFQAFSGNNNR